MTTLFNGVIKKYFKAMFNYSAKQPIVVILGATGTGKSKLALEMASKFDGEIISADSMQIYKGLDIATNKVTSEERAMVPHHMLDFLDPCTTYTVKKFQETVLPIISGLHEEGKVPIIVGGTHYYVESLLWNVLIPSASVGGESGRVVKEKSDDVVITKLSVNKSGDNEISDNNVCPPVVPLSDAENDKLNIACLPKVPVSEMENKLNIASLPKIPVSEMDNNKLHISDISAGYYNKSISKSGGDSWNCINSNVSNEELLKKLEEIDPEIALTYHPNNRRKILRSLEVWQQTGVRHSEHLRRQSEEVGGADLGGSARFENAAVLWVTCDQETLDKRLDARIEEMMERGLMEELTDFHSTYSAPLFTQKLKNIDTPVDVNKVLQAHYSKGIFQNIGLKEFHRYLSLGEDRRSAKEGQKLFAIGKEEMKMRTKKYSRKQIKWMKNRFVIRDRKKYPVYALDGSDLSMWNENVRYPAESIIESILKGETPTTSPCPIDIKGANINSGDKTRHICEICDRLFIGEIQWNDHQKSGKHRKMLKRKAEEENKQQPESFSNKTLKA